MSVEASSIRLEGDGERRRYVYPFEDGAEAELTFLERPPGLITIEHTKTPSGHRGQGVATALVSRAVTDFRAAGHRVIPSCPFAYKKFKEHPEWADVLYRR
jgi:uncharacterized protein